MPVHYATSVIWRGFLLVSAVTIGVGARVVRNPQPMPGYNAASATAQRGIEREAVAVPSPTNAAEHARALSREPHMAGTPAQARTRDYVIERMRAWGLETEVRAYEVWMPHPTSVRVWRVAPDAIPVHVVPSCRKGTKVKGHRNLHAKAVAVSDVLDLLNATEQEWRG